MLSWIRWWFCASLFAGLLVVGARKVADSGLEVGQGRIARSETAADLPPGESRGPGRTPSPAPEPVARATQGLTSYSLDPQALLPVPWFGEGLRGEPQFLSTEIGDVTGDFRDDLVVLGYDVSTAAVHEILVYAQKPDSTLAPPARYPIATDIAISTAMGDFNEDGIQDVLVTGYKEYFILLSNAKGTLDVTTPAIFDPVELAPEIPALPMHVDGDWHLDLVFFLTRTRAGSSGFPTTETLPRLLILYGDGLGGFGRRYSFKTYGVDPYDAEQPVSIASGDLNHDGREDLAIRVAQFHYGQQIYKQLIRVYLNDGSKLVPGFDLNATMETGSNYSAMDYISIGDFNGDGLDDLAGSPGSMDMRLWVRHQAKAGGFGVTPLVRASEPIGVSLVAADLDHDGKDDLLVGHYAWDRVTYHLQSNGQLSEPHLRYLQSGTGPRISRTGVSVGDLDSDGCTDAAVGLSYWGVRLLRGTNCAFRVPVLVTCRTESESSLTTSATAIGPTTGKVVASPAVPRAVVSKELERYIRGQVHFVHK